jgi:hypothetical protein
MPIVTVVVLTPPMIPMTFMTPLPPLPHLPTTLPTTPVNLLLQHDAVHARLEQGKHEAGLALQLAEAVEDVGRGGGGEVVEEGCELEYNEYIGTMVRWVWVGG